MSRARQSMEAIIVTITDETRRRFLGFFASAGLGGTLLPGVLWAQLQQDGAQTITEPMLQNALAISGLSFGGEDLKSMLQAFDDAYRRWPNGIFLMWYPIRSASQRSMVHQRFAALRIPKMLIADLAIHPDDAGVGLAGSGLMIVNPPYGTDEFLTQAYRAIHKGIAAPGAGYVEVSRLTPERMAQ